MKLFVVYLGGKVAEGRVGEDHEVVVVVAADALTARAAAKAKWRGVGSPHVDAVQELDVVDGYQINLTPVIDQCEDHAPIDTTWTP